MSSNNITALIARRLKAKRKECGFTLAQVSERADLSISFLSDIEIGKASPSLNSLAKLVECYQTTIAELCTEADAQEYVKQVRLNALKQARQAICVEIEMLEAEMVDEGVAV
jgi:transcriptional regulator with XRE-family HTH domain